MKYFVLAVMAFLYGSVYGQDTSDSLKRPRVFVASGMGFGFPMGEIKHTVYPKYSTSLGLTIPFKNEKVFIYPMIDFLSLGYNQDKKQEKYPFVLEKGTAKIYSLSIMPGINRFLNAANIYAFMGPSLQLVFEPNINIDVIEQRAKIEKVSYWTAGVRGGIGAHYKIGNFYLFIETGWMHNFHKMQERNVDILTAYGGLKTDVTSLANKVIGLF